MAIERKLWVPASAVSRRTLIVGGSAAAAGIALAACGSDDEGADSTATTAGGTDTTAAGGDTTPATTAASGDTTPATTAPAGEGKPGGTLRIGMVGSTNDIIDGQFIVAKPDQARLVLGWEPLVNYDADFNIVYEHSLAEEVEAKSADNYVIRLKQGITFHNGKDVTADDVIFSFLRRIDPDLGLAPALAQFIDANSFTKLDDRTVEVKLLQPSVTFLNGLAEYTATIVPDGYTREGEQIGTGPFKLESFTAGAESVHVRYDGYWGGAAYLDEVQIIDFADPTALVNALTSGQVDAVADLPFSQVGTLQANSDFAVIVSQAGSWLPITMAVDQAPFDDKRVRQAMRLIVDRPQMVERVLSGFGSVGPDMSGVLDASYPDDLPQREQDIEQAVALLAEAGQEGLTIDLFAPDDTAGLPEMAAAFAEMAKDAGVTVNVKVLDGGTYWGDEYTKRTFATSFWGTRPYLNQVAAGSLNDAVYPETHWPPAEHKEQWDAWYAEALAETDEAKRFEIIQQMQTLEYEEGGNIIWGFNNLIDATATYVKGFEARPNVLNLDHYGRGMKRVWLDV
ncbi:MAG: ABC transporter substrate-binding protein [Actinomycetes bacterium]